jgi:hypothetical protein
MTKIKPITRERIEAKVSRIPEAGCWIWMGSTQVRGYGELISNNRKHLAHRASYEAFVGKIPKGMYVCHACDNVSCVNPNHLFLGTQKQNLQDMANKGRSTRGVKNPMAKLDEYAVRQIREGIKEGQTNASLAKSWMVCPQTISNIRHKKVWNHV